jgi:hypothetical protein
MDSILYESCMSDAPQRGEDFPLAKGFVSASRDWGLPNAPVFKGKLQAIAAQMAIGRRPRSKV